MHAHRLASPRPHRLRLLLAGAGGLLLAACGGTTVNVGPGGSSGGGSNAVLAGTYTKANTSTRASDNSKVFGAVDSLGNGYFADLGGSSRAVFVFGSASQSGQLNGSFAAYAANGSNLGDGTTLRQGSVSGTVASASGVTTANVNYNASTSDQAVLVLDHPPQGRAQPATVAGTYTATTGAAAIASTALSVSGTATYTVSISSTGAFGLTSDAGCTLQSNGSASLDPVYNIYDLHVSGTCSGNTVTLDGLAIYLPTGSASPLDGSALTKDTLLVELSDFIAPGSSLSKALVLVAARSP